MKFPPTSMAVYNKKHFLCQIVRNLAYLPVPKVYLTKKKNYELGDEIAFSQDFTKSLVFQTIYNSWTAASTVCGNHHGGLYIPMKSEDIYAVTNGFNNDFMHLGIYKKDGSWVTLSGIKLSNLEHEWVDGESSSESSDNDKLKCAASNEYYKLIEIDCNTEVLRGLCVV